MKTKAVSLLSGLLAGVLLSGCAAVQSSTPANPGPAITALSPSTVLSGGPAFTLTVNGFNFLPTSVVRLNGSDRPTTFVNNTQLTTPILANDVVSAGIASITILNPAPGGGVSSAATLTVNNPVPVVSALGPSTAIAGAPAFTLTVDGSNFVSGSVVRWSGSNRATAFVSSTRLTAAILAGDVATNGPTNVTVFNPVPGGGSSNALSFVVSSPPPPTPAITSLSPAATTVGGPGFTLTVNGSNFISTSVVVWNDSDRSTTFVSSTQLTAAIPASDISSPGVFPVWVVSPGGTATSNSMMFTVPNPIPELTLLSPISAIAGDAPMTLVAKGSNFVNGSIVQWNGSDRKTTFINGNWLNAEISTTDLAAAGNAQVTVVNPGPGGGTSRSATFFIAARTSNPQPTIASASDPRVPAGWPGFALTLTGTGFVAASVAQWNGLNRPTTVLSNTQLRVAIPPEDLATVGAPQIAVFNTSPGGGTSNVFGLTIFAVAPNAVGVLDRASVGEGFASANDSSWGPAISADGRYIAFSSAASNLGPGDSNNAANVFLRDTCLGAPTGCTPSIISLPFDQSGWYILGEPSISATGRYVAYIEGTFLDNSDVVVADTCIGAPAGCSPGVTSVRANYDTFYDGWISHVSLSKNGRYVAYTGYNTNTYGSEIADTCLGAPAGCVPSKSGMLDYMYLPVLSADGRYVVFESDSSSLVPNDTNNTSDIFLSDTCRGAPSGCTLFTTRVSVASDGSEGNGTSLLGTISADGRFVAFTSFATNLVAEDTNGGHDVFLRDTCIGAPASCTPSTIRVSVASDGSQASAPSGGPATEGASLSADARFVAFGSRAGNLVSGDTNGTFDIFVRDTCLGVSSGCTPNTARVSVALDGTQGDDRSDVPRISADGRYVTFQSYATGLAPGDDNSVSDVFVARTGRQ